MKPTKIIIILIFLISAMGAVTADEMDIHKITNTSSYDGRSSIIFADDHYYLAYESNQNGNSDIFIKKYDINWNYVDEKQITTQISGQYSPSITFENQTGTIYVAYDSVETGNSDIFIQIYDLALNSIGEKRQITKDKTDQGHPSLTFANNYLYLAYFSKEKEIYEILMEKYDSNLNQLEKKQITDGGGWNPSITIIGDYLYIAYKKSEATDSDTIISKGNLNNMNSREIEILPYSGKIASIDIISKNDNIIVAFDYEYQNQYQPGAFEVYIDEYNLNLKREQNLGSIKSKYIEEYPSLTLANGIIYVAYTSYATGNGDLYVEKVIKNHDPPNIYIRFNEKDNNLYLVYNSYETGNWDIFLEKFDLNLSLLDRKQLTFEQSRQVEPFLTLVENNFYVAYASDDKDNWDIYINKYDFDWNLIEKKAVIEMPNTQGRPSIIHEGNNLYIAYHSSVPEKKYIFINKYDMDWNLIKENQIVTENEIVDGPSHSITFVKNNLYLVYKSSDNEIIIEKLDLDLNSVNNVKITSKYSLESPFITSEKNSLYVAYASNETGKWNITINEYDLDFNLIGEKEITNYYVDYEKPSIAVVKNELYLAHSSGTKGDYNIIITEVTLPLPPAPIKPLLSNKSLLLLIIALLLVFSGVLIYKQREEFMISKRYRYFLLIISGGILILLAHYFTEPDMANLSWALAFLSIPYFILIGVISKNSRESVIFALFAFLCFSFGSLLLVWLAYENNESILTGTILFFIYIIPFIAFSAASQLFISWIKEKIAKKHKGTIPNPYVAGVPIRDKQMYFGRKDVFDFLKQKLMTEKATTHVFLYGGRRIGKTSSLYQIRGGALGDKFIPIFVDLQGIGDMDTYGFFSFITQEIRKNLEEKGFKLKEYVFDNAKESYTITFNQVLDDVSNLIKDKQMILMFDETEIIEKMIIKGRFDNAINSYLENIMQHRPNISCIFTSSPGALNKKQEGKPFFRVATYKKISFLEKDDAIELIRKPVEGFAWYDDKIIERILLITGCHPFYIQYICYEIINILNKEKRNKVKMKDIDLVIKKLIKGAPMHLGYVWDNISFDEKIILSLLSEIIIREDEFISISAIEKFKNKKEKTGETTIKISDKTEKILEDLYREDILEKDPKKGYKYKVDLVRHWVKVYYSVWRVISEEHESKSK